MQRVYDCSVDTDLLTGFRQAKVALQRHEVVVIPTDTVYGIAVDAFSHKAVELLLKTKGRERSVPPPVLIPKVETLSALATDLPLVASKLAAAFWPGALTMVLRAQPSLDWDLGETRGTVALRVPDHKITLALLEDVGPLAVSSANTTGNPAAVTAQQAFDYFGDKVPVYLDGGGSPKGEASTILDLTQVRDGEAIRVLRKGALSLERIRSVIGDVELEVD
ncbi:L-threonylcarbamoyladenylate synthase [Candidatus Aquiluna sp. IMCC13023]|jgi:L-threonylcarbamoyladenylate synthase|uniref:L-threonylcarbamoyladenylate synthase n=1 Tax=Candidatus Aquiluna sp. IMCC13023 TaxID=1081644 RepID=UPI00058EF737|nr:L-threonylcarbamoyladenylate synthase [Candidatus Aquiluna sp. IMCC13023]|tara:strand:- start:323 stop:985 length:663 start_codon:yes stop_codon:yes gene_type:complete